MTDLSHAIEVAGLRFEYPGVRALDDVSFCAAPGEVTALVGPNGAGKTTLLRCLAGLERPMLGSITVAGIDVLEEPRACHRKIGYLSDFYGLYDTLTVRQCFGYAARAQGLAEGQAPGAVARIAERLGMEDRLATRAGELSRGLRQRVAIGQALIHAPEVLILDEPASGLDPEARHGLAQLFTRLRGEGMTLIVSSHILAELDEYSTHMLVLSAGRIIENRALAAPAADGRRVRLELAHPLPRLREALERVDGCEVLEARDGEAVLLVRGDAVARSELLRRLIAAGLSVAGFYEERENLQESYLRTVRGAREERAP